MADATKPLKELLLQAESFVGKQENKELPLKDQLSFRLQKLNIATTGDSQKTFVQECSQLLLSIQNKLNDLCLSDDQSTDQEYLGIKDMRLINTLLQVTISWGFYPNFLPGVGVPLTKRVKSGYTNHELFNSNSSHKGDTAQISCQQLFELTIRFINLIQQSASTGHTTVASILMTRHLPDLYAGLLQLAYGPISSSTKSNGPSYSVEQSMEQALGPEERDTCARLFVWLFNRSDAYRALESLMLLLGTSPLHPVPKWLRTICGRYLSRILLKPNGVNVLLGTTVGDEDHVQLAQLENISKLILAVPQQMPSVESYYAIIAPQLLNILQDSIRNSNMQSSKKQVVTFVIGKIIAKHTGLAQKYIVDAIVGKLLYHWNQTFSEQDSKEIDPEALSEDELNILLRTLHCVMIGGEPSPIVIQTFLEASIPALYHLYEFTIKSKSSLRETVLDILTTYFRIMTTAEAANALKAFLSDSVDMTNSRVAYFAPGSHGGTTLRLRRSPQGVSGDKFHIDTSVFVEFLQTINNADICGDLFVYFLEEYASVKALSSATDPRRMLLIIQLIMKMLDALGTSILRHPAQIIAFATNIVLEQVQRPAKAQESRDEKKINFTNIVSEKDLEAINDADDDTYTNNDELESLVLALSLLRTVLYENDSVDQPTVARLQTLVEPLKQLESQHIDFLEEPIREAIIAITSFLTSQSLSDNLQNKGNANLEASKEKYRDALKALKDELLPVRAHGIRTLKEMILAKDPILTSEGTIGNILDLFIQLVQDEDSFIYLNAIQGLSAITDIYGNEIITKLGAIYSNEGQHIDNRLRIGEVLLQTIKRSGEALSKYVKTLMDPLEVVLARRNEDNRLRLSALAIMGVACEIYPVALSARLEELTSWALNILAIERTPEVRRAAIVLILSLFRGFASQTLYSYPADNLSRTYRTLRYVEDTDEDQLTRYHARVALSDLDAIMRNEIFPNT